MVSSHQPAGAATTRWRGQLRPPGHSLALESPPSPACPSCCALGRWPSSPVPGHGSDCPSPDHFSTSVQQGLWGARREQQLRPGGSARISPAPTPAPALQVPQPLPQPCRCPCPSPCRCWCLPPGSGSFQKLRPRRSFAAPRPAGSVSPSSRATRPRASRAQPCSGRTLAGN